MQHITNAERDLLAKYQAEGKSIRLIARLLGRSHSTIVREIQRNGTSLGYSAIAASGTAYMRIHVSHHRHPLKKLLRIQKASDTIPSCLYQKCVHRKNKLKRFSKFKKLF